VARGAFPSRRGNRGPAPRLPREPCARPRTFSHRRGFLEARDVAPLGRSRKEITGPAANDPPRAPWKPRRSSGDSARASAQRASNIAHPVGEGPSARSPGLVRRNFLPPTPSRVRWSFSPRNRATARSRRRGHLQARPRVAPEPGSPNSPAQPPENRDHLAPLGGPEPRARRAGAARPAIGPCGGGKGRLR